MENRFKNNPLPKNYSSSRTFRNQAEKQRRDKLNFYVGELASLVPFVVRAQKKVDKTSVLRLAASYIRLHQILDKNKQAFTGTHESLKLIDAPRSLMNAVGGFLLVLSSSGQVIYASESIEDAFGYTQADILGQSFFHLIHAHDIKILQQKLTPKDNPRLSFYCRMLEKTQRSEPAKYEIVHIVGQLKELPQRETATLKTQPLRPRRRTTSGRRVHDAEDEDFSMASSSPSPARESDTHMLVAFVEVVKDRPITELSRIESLRDEYITRHNTDCSILYTDHRISFVAGLMPEEVTGRSAFSYMYQEDLIWNLLSLREMFLNPEGQGVVTYRLKCRDGSLALLRSRGFLEVNKSSGKVETFVCINTVLTEKEAVREVRKQRAAVALKLSGENPRELATRMLSELFPGIRQICSVSTLESALRNIICQTSTEDWNYDIASPSLTPRDSMVPGLETNPPVITEVQENGNSSEPLPTHKRKSSSIDPSVELNEAAYLPKRPRSEDSLDLLLSNNDSCNCLDYNLTSIEPNMGLESSSNHMEYSHHMPSLNPPINDTSNSYSTHYPGTINCSPICVPDLHVKSQTSQCLPSTNPQLPPSSCSSSLYQGERFDDGHPLHFQHMVQCSPLANHSHYTSPVSFDQSCNAKNNSISAFSPTFS